jgi:hypothetical protein
MSTSPPTGASDRVLASFLATAADEPSFHDPSGLMPPRWRQMAAADRRAWFVEVFTALIRANRNGEEPLLVTAEPSVAALMFYGVARLLPGGLRDELSYSTFEPDSEQPSSPQAATWLLTPQTAVRQSQSGGKGGPVVDTTSISPAARAATSGYAAAMVQRLLADGWEEIDRELAALQSAGARRWEDLDELTAIGRFVPAVLASGAVPGGCWPGEPKSLAYLRRSFGRRLSAAGDLAQALKPVVQGPAHLRLVELLAVEPDLHGVRPVIEHLLKNLTGEQIVKLLAIPAVPMAAKRYALVSHINAQGALPPGCEPLWAALSEAAGAPEGVKSALLYQVLTRVTPEALERLSRNARGRNAGALLIATAELVRHGRMPAALLTSLVPAVDEEALLAVPRSCREELLAGYPAAEPAMRAKLQSVLRTLGRQPERFNDRLDLILAGAHLLADDSQRRIASAWAGCRGAILELGRLQNQDEPARSPAWGEQLEAAAQQLAEAAVEAMPDAYEPLSTATKQSRLDVIAGKLLVGRLLLPAGTPEFEIVRKNIATYLESREWPDWPVQVVMAPIMPELSLSSRRATEKIRKIQALFVLGIILVVLLIAWLGIQLFGSRAPGVKQQAVDSGAKTEKTGADDPRKTALELPIAAAKTPAEVGDSKAAEVALPAKAGAEAKTGEPAKTGQGGAVQWPKLSDPPADARTPEPESKSDEMPGAPPVKEATQPASRPIKPAPIEKDEISDDKIAIILGDLEPVPGGDEEPGGVTGAAFLRWDVALPGTKAKVKPKWFEPFITACQIRVTNADGTSELTVTRLHDFKLPPGADSVRVRISFSTAVVSDDPLDNSDELVAESAWFDIKDIVRGKYYAVRFKPSDRGLEKLRGLAKGLSRSATQPVPRPGNM